MLLKIDAQTEERTLRVVVSGEFDVAGVERFRMEVEPLPAGVERVHVDLRDVAFMDSSALQELVRLRNRSREGEFELTLVQPSYPVRRLLELTGLASRFEITT